MGTGFTQTRAMALFLFCTAAACGSGEEHVTRLSWDFSRGEEQWSGGASDYPVGWDMSLEIGIAPLPAPLDTGRTAFLTSGQNRSDDLFTFLKRRVTGLQPATRYQLRYRIAFATRSGDIDAMVLKAGGSTVEPATVVEEVNTVPYHVMNVDKGSQAQGGASAAVLGTTRKPHPGTPDHELQSVEGTSVTVSTDAEGALWLLVGTESVFEVLSEIYYTEIEVDLLERR